MLGLHDDGCRRIERAKLEEVALAQGRWGITCMPMSELEDQGERHETGSDMRGAPHNRARWRGRGPPPSG
jgi:hypothetical protein